MYTPQELEKMPKQFERYMQDLEQRVMEDVVLRIKKNAEVTATADWNLLRISELRGFNNNFKKYIQSALELSSNEINMLFYATMEQGYVRNKKLYDATGKSFVAFKDNKELQQLIGAVIKQTSDELVNITQTMGFMVEVGGKLQITPLSEYFSGILDGAMMDVTSGIFDYNKTIKRVIDEMTRSGLRTVEYASGYSCRADVAARRAIMTGIGQITGKINEQNAEKLNTEYFEVTWHETARPSHQKWHGRVYTKKELVDICGLGTVEGLCGANCRHNYYPFIPGISERTYTDEQLDKMHAEENKKKAFGGKEYTSYEASQYMRQMEGKMRAQRKKIKLLETAEADEETIVLAKGRYQITSQRYVAFAEEMELPQERVRVYGDGLGKLVDSSVAKKAKDVIIKREIKKLGFGGQINLIPTKIDTSKLAFDDVHINHERKHAVSFEEAVSYINNAKVSQTVWNGRFERYYSEAGAAYFDKEKNLIRTAFSAKEYTKNIIALLEVLKKYDR